MSSVFLRRNQVARGLRSRTTHQGQRTFRTGPGLISACVVLTIVSSDFARGAPNPQQENRRQRVTALLSLQACTLQQLSVEVVADTLRTVLRVDDETWTLVATRHSLRSTDFRVLVQETANGPLVEIPAPPVRTYRGTILERPGLVATLSFADGRLVASINTPTDVYTIEQVVGLGVDAPKDEYVVYRNSDMLADTKHRCGVEDGLQVDGGESLSPPGTGTIAGTGFSVAEIAADADFEFFVKNGSDVSATVLDIETILDAVSAVYERDVNITYEVTTIIVRTVEEDPFTSTDPSTLLCEFRTAWNTSPEFFTQRDVTHLFTGKDLNGDSVGAAFQGPLCAPPGNVPDCGPIGVFAYALAESFFKPSFSARVAISAHELGHIWNAQHCDIAGGACHIMCAAIGTLVAGACGNVEGENLNFSAMPVAAITAFRDTLSCLDTQGSSQSLPFSDDFLADPPDPTLWTFVDGAEVTGDGANEPSSPFALTLNATGSQAFRDDEIRSNFILLGQAGSVSLSFHTQHIGVPSGGTLDIDYRADNLTWQPLDQIVSDGVDQSAFVSHIHELPADALHDEFRIRFRVDVDDTAATWFVDNVRVFEGCATNDQCDDTIDCTIDTCEPTTGVCTNAPDDSLCDDLTFCTGGATCDVSVGCLPAPPACPAGLFCRESPLPHCVICDIDAHCDDGVACNGLETCVNDECLEGNAPCESPQTCDAPLDRCVDPSCAPPTMAADSPRYLAITPAAGTEPINLLVTPSCDPSATLYVAAPTGPGNIAIATADPSDAALLTPTEWGGTVHVTGEAVVPTTTYLAFANCGTEALPLFSVSDDATTEKWGDVVGSFGNGAWMPPNGVVDIQDVVAILDGFSGRPTAPPVYQVDLFGVGVGGFTCSPDQVIGIIPDVTSALDTFGGSSFPEATGCSVPCP